MDELSYQRLGCVQILDGEAQPPLRLSSELVRSRAQRPTVPLEVPI